MKGRIDNIILEKELELIIQSPQFINSDKDIKLLDYLIKKTLARESVKEAHIAIDVFNKEGDFDPSIDSTVRVYVGKLRKKLENFYLSQESQGSSVKINIPKGSYSLKFERRRKTAKVTELKRIIAFLGFITLALLGVFIIHLIDDKSGLFSGSRSFSNSPVWQEYTNSDLPVLFADGDFYFMSRRMDGNRYIIRDNRINSKDEFFQSTLDSLGFHDFRNSYSPSNHSECVAYFIPHFVNNNQNFRVKRASRLTWEDVNSNNLIYIGDFKALYILSRLLPRFNIRYNLDEKSFSLLDENEEPLANFNYFNRDQDGVRHAHILVSKRPGGNNNNIILILALGRGGLSDITEKLCDPEFLNDFIKTYQVDKKTPFYFDAVFRIERVDGTSLHFEVEYFKQITP